jgi:hypothetical protein
MNPDHIDEWYDERRAASEETKRQVAEYFPELLGGPGGNVRLLCPRGHRLLTVHSEIDHNFHPFLAAVKVGRFESGRQVAFDAGPLGGARAESDIVHAERVRFECPQRKCSYRGVFTSGELMRHYAVALRLGRSEITLAR